MRCEQTKNTDTSAKCASCSNGGRRATESALPITWMDLNAYAAQRLFSGCETMQTTSGQKAIEVKREIGDEL